MTKGYGTFVTSEADEFEAQLDEELAEWEGLLARSVKAFLQAVETAAGSRPMSPADARELKRLHRELIKRLHPDLHPGQSAEATHIHGIDDIVKRLEADADLRLEREPGNMADAWAIKVYAGKDRIGYVPADCNEILARLMDGGKALSAKLTGKEKLGTWNKLHMVVSLDD